MRRYIDAESLLTKIKAYRPYMYLGEDALSYSIKMVELEPSADVRENVRGEWIVKKDIINCSVCKRCSWSKSYEDLVRSFNFCPNCGADMKGGKHE